MIYTVTINPSVDVLVKVDDLKIGELNRALDDTKLPGGKAVNVSRTLNNLEIPTIATGFLGGFTGTLIKDYFDEKGINNSFVWIEDDTRINFKLIDHNKETLVNGLGPKIQKDELNDFLYYMSRVGEGDFVIMGGSLPLNAPSNIYDRLITICTSNGANFVLDIPTKQMYDALDKKPLMIRTSKEELEDMFEKKIDSIEDVINASEKCIEKGAKNVLVSLNDNGAIMATEYGVYRSLPIVGKVVNTLSAKDAMLAAWIGTYMRRNDEVESFRFASAALAATEFVEDLPTKEQIDKLAGKIIVEKIR